MKYLTTALLFIALYELVKHLYEKYYKNWKNKYFCGKVCEREMLLHPFKERIFYDNFSVFVGHNNSYSVILDSNTIATWWYSDGKIKDLYIYNEELFKTFKEKYILENN